MVTLSSLTVLKEHSIVMLACFQLPRECVPVWRGQQRPGENGFPVTNLEATEIYFGLLSLNFICAFFGQTRVCYKKKKKRKEK